MKAKHAAYVGLGSNLENPELQVRRALAALRTRQEFGGVQASSLYRSAPLGYAGQPDFVNAVARLDTELGAPALFAALIALEGEFGRTRSFRDAPRVLDLDLLLYDDLRLATDTLLLPHPRMHERAFVLEPLLEIAPDCVIPGRGPAAEWRARCADQAVSRIGPP